MLICCDLLNDFLWEFHACCWPKFFSVPQTWKTGRQTEATKTFDKTKWHFECSACLVNWKRKRNGIESNEIERLLLAQLELVVACLTPCCPALNPPIWSMCVCHANLNLSKTKGGGMEIRLRQTTSRHTGKKFDYFKLKKLINFIFKCKKSFFWFLITNQYNNQYILKNLLNLCIWRKTRCCGAFWNTFHVFYQKVSYKCSRKWKPFFSYVRREVDVAFGPRQAAS